MTMDVHSLYRDVLAGARVDGRLAAWLFRSDGAPLEDLLYCAGRLRCHFFGTKVNLCAIINAKSGRCDQDCRFCAQSGRYRTGSPTYPLVSAEQCLSAALQLERFGVRCFSIVTSGKAIESRKEIDTIKAAIAAIREKTHLEVAASLGTLSAERLRELKEAGLTTYHHNPETSPGFYPQVCTTHRFEERIRTIKEAKEAGLQVCGGGIFGMGEDAVQRAEFAVLLRELPVSRIPVNFLNPIAGTPLGTREPLRPLECLRIIAALRFVVPDKEIVICGGRQVGLRALQPFMFQAGASGLMTGDYLTTKGQAPAADIEMIRDLELEISSCGTTGDVPVRPSR